MKVCVICKKLATLCKFWKDLYTFLSVWYCPQRPTIKKDQIQDRKKENNRGLLTISNWLIEKHSYMFWIIYIIEQNCFITNRKLNLSSNDPNKIKQKHISIWFRVANLLGFSFIAINNKIRPIYCNKSNKIQLISTT